MIEPKGSDMGRMVAYFPRHAPDKPEVGEITSFNSEYVFVKYGVGNITSKATLRADLNWW